MTFEKAAWLWALTALPVLALFEWRAVERAKRAARTLVGPRADHALLGQAMPHSRRVGFALRLGSLALLILGAAGPQWGRETVRRQSQGSDLVFVVDVSASMDARDVAPSRLGEARREALGLLDRVQGSRVGVVGFAGDAVRLCPLTLDHASARLVIESLSSSSVTTPGTDLGKAIRAALKLLPQGRREEQAIVLWTDGEDLEGGAREAVEEAKRSGVRVFAVGVGTPAGDVIPVYDNSGQATDIKRNEDGQVVRSRLDEKLLRDLARSTRGAYFAAARAGGELPRLAAAMGSLGRSSRGARLVERPVSRFTWLALFAVAALGADLARARRREDRPRRAALAKAAALALVAGAVFSSPADAQSPWAKGDRAFKAGRWSDAETLYARRAKTSAPAPLKVNLATARALNGKSEAAERELSRLTAEKGAAGQMAGYNLGTHFAERQELEKALAELRRAIERDPSDADARWNYELVRRQLEEKKKQQGGSKKDPEQKPQQPSPGEQQPQGKGGDNQQPQSPQQGSPPTSPQSSPPPKPGPGGAPGMTRQQAEQLLGSLQELERLERQRSQRVRAMRERKGKDW